ncbi:hypothetical protein [Chryseobacterium sp. CT-SW4]|uniref:hypothetical protein n=1 Tax=Chryseobacterium sp. SW-1 TaxID=3157343 RepID=UPI003B027020
MKKELLLPLLVASSFMGAQEGIGTMGVNTPNPTETLDVNGSARVRNLKTVTSTDNVVFADANGVLKKSDISYAQLQNLINQSTMPATANIPVYAYVESTDPGITSTDNGSNVFVGAPLYQSPAGVMSNGVFTAPIEGVYMISSRAPMVQTRTGSADGGMRSKLHLKVNGNDIATYENALVLKTAFYNLSEVQFSRIVKLNAGDTVKVTLSSALIYNAAYLSPSSMKDQGYPYLSIYKVN